MTPMPAFVERQNLRRALYLAYGASVLLVNVALLFGLFGDPFFLLSSLFINLSLVGVPLGWIQARKDWRSACVVLTAGSVISITAWMFESVPEGTGPVQLQFVGMLTYPAEIIMAGGAFGLLRRPPPVTAPRWLTWVARIVAVTALWPFFILVIGLAIMLVLAISGDLIVPIIE